MLLPGEVSLAPERAHVTWMFHGDRPQKEHSVRTGSWSKQRGSCGCREEMKEAFARLSICPREMSIVDLGSSEGSLPGLLHHWLPKSMAVQSFV